MLGLLVACVALASVVALLGLDADGAPWKLIALPLALAAAGLARLAAMVRVWARAPSIVPVHAADRPELRALCGGKATGLARIAAAGLPIADGFVVTSAARRRVGGRAFKRALAATIRRLGAARLIVRSSFAGEDTAERSAAGIFHTEPDVPPTAAAVCSALEKVWASALAPEAAGYDPGHGLGVVVQRQLDCEALGVVSSVDPRTGFEEIALVQRQATDGASAVTLTPYDRIRGQTCPEVEATDRLAARWSGPVEVEVGWPRDGGFVVLQCRPLLGVPDVTTFVNGGPAAVPAVPLTPASRERYTGREGLAARLRRALEPMGLPGPADDDVRERDGRFYLRWRPAWRQRPPRRIRWARAALGLVGRPLDPVLAGAQALVLANAWWDAARRVAPVPVAVRAALEAGLQPTGRPATPEELADPGYDDEWPAWAPPPPPTVPASGLPPLKRWLQRLCLRRYRRWLVDRFVQRERVLADQRAHRAGLGGIYGTPEELTTWRAQRERPAPAVWHPGAEEVSRAADTGGAWGAAVPGEATGRLALGDPGERDGVLLVVGDARSVHARHFDRVVGLIVDRAGPLSHLVLLARERGIPTVIGSAPDLPDGTRVHLNASRGTLTALPEEPCSGS